MTYSTDGEKMSNTHVFRLFGLLVTGTVLGVCVSTTFSTARAQDTVDEAIVHLRTYYTESYLLRASLLDPEDRPFNSVWVTAKYYPGSRNGGNQASQAIGVKRQLRFAREKLGIEAHGGYVLHPTEWLSLAHWQQRAEALERLIVEAELTGSIALDIEAYGFDDVTKRPPSPNDKKAQRMLVDACRPIVDVLRRHNLSATIYPAGGSKARDYTAAAIALGATKFGDEYSFVFSKKILEGKTFSEEQFKRWRDYLSYRDSSDTGVPTIPGLFASVMRSKHDWRILRGFGVKEAWLFVDDKNWLRRRAPTSTPKN